MRDGVWNGRRILPERWVQEATSRHAKGVAPGWDYGYQWWITAQDGVDVWAGRGFGGQLLIVIPARETVAVVYSWNVFGSPARNIAPPLMGALTRFRFPPTPGASTLLESPPHSVRRCDTPG